MTQHRNLIEYRIILIWFKVDNAALYRCRIKWIQFPAAANLNLKLLTIQNEHITA